MPAPTLVVPLRTGTICLLVPVPRDTTCRRYKYYHYLLLSVFHLQTTVQTVRTGTRQSADEQWNTRTVRSTSYR
jgi:hypothetical protein